MEDTESESLVGRILYKISVLHQKEVPTSKYTKKTFPDKFHPRRHKLYRPFVVDNDMFFRLRSHGVPILTAYFMSESNNMCSMHKQIQEKNSLERDDALSIIKNI